MKYHFSKENAMKARKQEKSTLYNCTSFKIKIVV